MHRLYDIRSLLLPGLFFLPCLVLGLHMTCGGGGGAFNSFRFDIVFKELTEHEACQGAVKHSGYKELSGRKSRYEQ